MLEEEHDDELQNEAELSMDRYEDNEYLGSDSALRRQEKELDLLLKYSGTVWINEDIFADGNFPVCTCYTFATRTKLIEAFE